MGNDTFEEMAVRITPSPPPSQGSASSAVESKYLSQVKLIHYARIGLSTIFIVLGTAVIGTEGHALQVYNHTHLNSEWWLPLWPQYFDLRPTVTVLIGSAIVVFASLVHIIGSVLPAPRSRTTMLSIVFTTLTILNLLTLLVTLGYTVHIKHQDKRLDRTNLSTWTCRWASGVSGASVATSQGASESASTIFGGNGGIDPPDGFRRLCRETKAAWYITITMASLVGTLGLGIVTYGWWVAFRVWRERRIHAKNWGKESSWVMQNENGNIEPASA